MATLPTFENILLEINQSLGGKSYSTGKKTKFLTRRISPESHQQMVDDIFEHIADKLTLDEKNKEFLLQNIKDAERFFTLVEQNIWTGKATKQQIVWLWLAYIGTPGFARHMAFWNIDAVTDKGMSGGIFWYLPEIIERNNKLTLYLPVAQIVDWLLDLLGISMQELATEYSAKIEYPEIKTDKLIRTLYNWRMSENVPQIAKFEEFFPDSLDLDFKGCFIIKDDASHTEQFSLALQFVKQKFGNLKKEQIAEILSHEIPITQLNILKNILSGDSDNETEKQFIKLLATRYAKPTPRIIRHYFLMARVAQDCYIRLLKFLFPKVDKLDIDPSKNKLLQIILLYKHIYNLSIETHKRSFSVVEEEKIFKEKIPTLLTPVFLSIYPSKSESDYIYLYKILTDKFLKCNPQDELEDIYPYNEEIMEKLELKLKNYLQNELEINDKSEKLKKLFPFSTQKELSGLLKSETRFEVIYDFLNTAYLNSEQYLITVEKLAKLAESSVEKILIILLKLFYYLDSNYKQPDDVFQQVESLLKEAEESEDYIIWKAPFLSYKAKHLLSQDNFKGAKKLLLEAFNYCANYNYGNFRSEIASNILAIDVEKGKFIPQNHQRYCREIPFLQCWVTEKWGESCANWCPKYFKQYLYKPYKKKE